MLGVLTLVYFGLQRVGGMSDRFFASTLDGANGLVRYLVGDYIGAARAYRAHYGCGIGSCGVPRPSLGGYVTGTGGQEWGARRRRALLLPILLPGSHAKVTPRPQSTGRK